MFSLVKDINTCPKIAGKILASSALARGGGERCVYVGGGGDERKDRKGLLRAR